MKKITTIAIIAAVVIVVFVALGPFWILEEGFQGIVVRFGELVRVEQDAGLKFKTPLIENIVIYPKKIMAWDGDSQRIPTKENQFIWIDTTARWRISDPRKYYESINTIESGFARLDDIIDSAVRNVIAANYLREAVRNSNDIMKAETKENIETGDAEGSQELLELTRSDAIFDEISKGRRQLSEEMITLSKQMMPQYGIELIDIVPRQIKYSDELTESVYSRMTKERNQIAQAFRSYGEGKKAEWMGKLENENRSILSKAYEESETLKGKADAEATKIFADAYGRDTSFYTFWKALESYKLTLPNFKKTLTTDLDYFKFLYSPRGR